MSSSRLQSLLVCLILNADTPPRRQHLAFRFWPDSTEKQARTNLRHLLHDLRHALPESDQFIRADAQTVTWRRDAPFTLDVARFEETLARAREAEERGDGEVTIAALEAAIRLYRGDLMPACYDEWIEPERVRLRAVHLAALSRLIGLLEMRGAYRQAIDWGRQLLRGSPLDEQIYATLMRLHAGGGDRAGALRVYHQCRTALAREIGVAPGPEIAALHDHVLELAPVRDVSAAPETFAAELSLVGRKQEWERLKATWEATASGRAGAVLITGEAGIGKTRLGEELLVWVARLEIACGRSRSYEAEGRLAYGPIADWLRGPALREGVRSLEPVWLAEVARIVPEVLTERPDLPRPGPLTESWRRRLFFEALERAVLAAPLPIVLLIDDLQWCDLETVEWLDYLLHAAADAPLLIIGTIRPEELAPDHPLHSFRSELRRREQLVEIPLEPLDAQETRALAGQIAGGELGSEQASYLSRETEGNPLFIVESVRMGFLEPREASCLPLRSEGPASLPPRVHAVIAQRLARLSPETRELARLAATVGRAFTFEVLAAASDLEQDELVCGLDELWHRRILREYDGGTYDFSHDKLREVAYGEIPPARRRQLHRRVAEALLALRFSTQDAVASQLAAHYELADAPEEAILYYRRAADVAQRSYADEEAIRHLRRALHLLAELPRSRERDQEELGLHIALGRSLTAARGWAAPETGRAYGRAVAISDHAADPSHGFAALWGLWAFQAVRGELRKARQTSERLVRHAEEQDREMLVSARSTLAMSLFHMGELERAAELLGQGAPREHLQRHDLADPVQVVLSLSYRSFVLWFLGFPDQALSRSGEALQLSEEVAHPFSQGIALAFAAIVHQLRGEPAETRECADAAVAVCRRHEMPYYLAWATILGGWGRAAEGELARGLEEMWSGLRDLLATGAEIGRPYYLGLIAGAHAEAGEVEAGVGILSEALAVVHRNEEHWCEPELHRLRGELLRLQGDAGEAERCFRCAIGLAGQLHARMPELRAATSLGRLWRDRNRCAEAHSLLKEVLDRFTEGCDLVDLREAAALLKETGAAVEGGCAQPARPF